MSGDFSGDFSGGFSGDGRVMSFDFVGPSSQYARDMRLEEWWLPDHLYNPRVQHNPASGWFNLDASEVKSMYRVWNMCRVFF